MQTLRLNSFYLIIFFAVFFGNQYSLGAGSERFTCPSTTNPACNIASGDPWVASQTSMSQRMAKLETQMVKVDLDDVSSTLSQRLNTVEGQAVGTMSAATNQNSCFYDNDFDCTESSLTHVYQTKSWTTPGNYTWTVPDGITQIYAIVVSGQGGGGGGSYGSDGGDSFFGVVQANGGSGGSSSTGGSAGGDGLINSKDDYVSVTTGNTINIQVGQGGDGANGGSYSFGNGGGGPGANGANGTGAGGSPGIIDDEGYGYYGPAGAGGSGANGSVTIKY